MIESRSSHRLHPILGVILLALLGLACATSPTGRRQLTLFSKRDMAQLGH